MRYTYLLDDEMNVLFGSIYSVSNSLELEFRSGLHAGLDSDLQVLVFSGDFAFGIEQLPFYTKLLLGTIKEPNATVSRCPLRYPEQRSRTYSSKVKGIGLLSIDASGLFGRPFGMLPPLPEKLPRPPPPSGELLNE